MALESKPESREEASYRDRLAYNLQRLRAKADLSQEEIAHRAGLSVRHYQFLEHGRANVTLSSITKLCKAWNIDILELFRNRSK